MRGVENLPLEGWIEGRRRSHESCVDAAVAEKYDMGEVSSNLGYTARSRYKHTLYPKMCVDTSLGLPQVVKVHTHA